MPRAPQCSVPCSSLWLASVALVVHAGLSSSQYQRPVVGAGKRAGFMERTLILLDVDTHRPIRVLNDNFLSLQLDPAIIKDGWLDFLSSKRLVTLARGLSPAYLRFGGKRTDFLQFHNLKNLAKFRGPGPDYYLKNYEDGASYYMDGRVRKVEDFLKTRLLDTLSEQINKVFKVVHSHAPGKKVWLGGVGPAWAAGTNNLSDTYAAGFLWLNTLGMAAAQGVDVVLRHSLFDYGYTHLVDQHFNPLPDYWLSLVFKRLVGPRVLAVRVAGLQRKPRPGRVIRDKLRIYAHCTSSSSHNYVKGSITIYIINLHRSRKKIKLAGTLRNKTVHQYLFQPYGADGLHAKYIQLNGQKLVMLDDGAFPELSPVALRAGRTVVMPPMSIGFYVIKNINAYACRR
ncbi:inactive heparanase-2 [Gadus chalcogrammus]|uniref:inactive heparanase-2 n=1 Tax=Gadus chalcogrammus TaxID=1042646 RepID=UPI0024C4A462|nr:inactive heparanase-2 [Gadus chalcogrammus]